MPPRKRQIQPPATSRPVWWTHPALPVLVVLAIAAPATACLFHAYSISGFDTEFHILALGQVDRCVSDGQLQARWFPDMGAGFGYPMLIFYPPLVYWVAMPFVWLGAGYPAAVDITVALAILGAAVAMYVTAAVPWGRRAGILAAAAYTYAPYHLVTAYVKGAVAELFSFVWVPLIFLSFFRLQADPSALRTMGLAAVYAALILTNNSSALLFSMVFVPYVIFAGIRTRSIRFVTYAFAGLLGGLLLSCFFWLPAMFEKDYVQISRMTSGYFDFSRHFVSWEQLFYSPWNYGGSGFSNQFCRMAGVMQWVMVAAGIGGLWRRDGRALRMFFVLAFLGATAMMLAVSFPIWNAAPLLRFLQFPWKFLAVTMLAGAFLCGSVFTLARGERARWTLLGVSLVVVLALDLSHAHPEVMVARPPDFAGPADARQLTLQEMSRNDFTHYYTSYLPIQATTMPLTAALTKLPPTRGLAVLSEEIRTDRYRFRVRLDEAMPLVINTFWFPGWEAMADGRAVALEPEAGTGRITLHLDRGEHDVYLRFGATRLRLWALIVSCTTAVAAAVVAVGLAARDGLFQRGKPWPLTQRIEGRIANP